MHRSQCQQQQQQHKLSICTHELSTLAIRALASLAISVSRIMHVYISNSILDIGADNVTYQLGFTLLWKLSLKWYPLFGQCQMYIFSLVLSIDFTFLKWFQNNFTGNTFIYSKSVGTAVKRKVRVTDLIGIKVMSVFQMTTPYSNCEIEIPFGTLLQLFAITPIQGERTFFEKLRGIYKQPYRCCGPIYVLDVVVSWLDYGNLDYQTHMF